MRKLLSGSITTNLVLVAASGILPVLLVILASGAELRTERIAGAETDARRLAESIADQQTVVTMGVRQLLVTLSLIPDVRRMNVQACGTIFREIVRQNPVYANITLLDAAGNVLASALPFDSASFADQKHVRDAIISKEFSPGEYLVGRVSAVPIVAFALPLLDEGGRVAAVLTTSLDIRHYQIQFDESHLPQGSILSLLDNSGRRLFYHPATPATPIGEKINPLVWEAYEGGLSGVERHTGMDDVRRIYAFQSVRAKPEAPAYMTVVVGIPEAQALASADSLTKKHLAWLTLAALLSFLLAWVVGRRGIVLRLNRLATVASELGKGNLAARTGLELSSGTLGTLARAFDTMAEAVEVRECERHASDEALRQSEDRYRSMVEEQTELVCRFNPDGQYTFVNEAYCRFFGKTREELLDRRWYPEALAEDLPMFQERLARLCPDEPEAQFENRVRAASGELRWVQFTNKGLFSAAGILLEVQSVGRDVTDRKRAEEALRESEAKYRRLHESMTDAYAFVDMSGTIVECNKAFEVITGYTERELHTLTYPALTPEKWHAFEAAIVHDEILVRGHSPVYEKEYRSKDGRVFPVELRTFLLRGDEGQPEGMWAIVRDITERKRVEQELRQSEEKFRSLFDSMTEGAAVHEVVYDAAGKAVDYRILDVNPAYEAQTGIGRSLAAGAMAGRLYGTGEPPFLDIYTAVAEGGEPAHFETFFPPMKRYFSISVFSLGKCRFATVFKDVTMEREAQGELLRAKEAAEAANRAKSEFLANMSHEIRTPLNGVLGMLQLLQSTRPTVEQKEYLLSAIQSSRRLTRLLSDILDLSRIEAGKLVIQESEFEVMNQKQSVMELFEAAAKQKGLDLVFFIDDRLPPKLVGDETRLRQILFNLVGNAVKFTEKGQVRVEASLLVIPDAKRLRVLFTVQDTGVGIPDDRLRDIFEPFVQAEGSYTRRFQGAGLGLSIVRKLVDILGGDIALDSNEGGGTTICVSLPFKLPDGGIVQAGQLTGAASPADLERLRILLADDDEVSLISGKRMLEKSGYTVVTARDGQQALKRLGEGDFDLVLMDVQMPVMDGVEATRRIRAGDASEAHKAMPIIAMTAYAMLGDREKFLAVGMDDYIAKPVEMEALKEVIKRVITCPPSGT